MAGKKQNSTGRNEDKSAKVSQKPKLDFELRIRERTDLTDKQKEILKVALDKNTKVVWIDGAYGSSKTFLAVLASLKLMNEKKISDIIYLRNPVESSTTGKIGFLKGSTEEKMAPYLAPLYDKLDEFLSPTEVTRLKNEERILGMPIGFIRGHSWNCKAIIVDEASSIDWDSLFLILTRCGQFTKIFFIGDSKNQNDIGAKSGFRKMFDLFNDDESRAFGIHTFEMFEISDIVRSELLKFVLVKTGIIKDKDNRIDWEPDRK